MHLVVSVCPSISPLIADLFDLQPFFFASSPTSALGWLGLKVKVLGQKSRSDKGLAFQVQQKAITINF